MLDIQWIRSNPDAFDQALALRGHAPMASIVINQDLETRKVISELQLLQTERNQIAKTIGEAKRLGQETEILSTRASEIKQSMNFLEESVRVHETKLHQMLASLPNSPAPTVPVGQNEHDNVFIRAWGALPQFSFTPKPHEELGEQLQQMDFATAATMSGARFVILKNQLAQLERALSQFMLDLHTQKFGYQEISTPYLVRESALYNTGQLPKFREDLFQASPDHWLISTAEISLTNTVAQQILEERQLPMRLTAHTPCFRSEAGAAGRDTRGMIRLHQFSKVELVTICHPDQSLDEHERMTNAAETVLQQLELPYRIMELCTGDLGITVQKTYDLEVWFPAQNQYREISSCSNCGEFQARRMQARFRPQNAQGAKPQFVHTLNGSGLAVGRTLAAILENYQQADGTIRIPTILIPYMRGEKIISCS